MAQHLKPHKSARWKSSRILTAQYKQNYTEHYLGMIILLLSNRVEVAKWLVHFFKSRQWSWFNAQQWQNSFFFSIVWLLGRPSLKNGSYIIFRLFFELSGKERNWLIFSVWCWLIVCGGMYLKCCFLDTAVRLFKVLVCNQHSLPIQRGSKEFMFCCWCFRKKSL